MKQIARLSTGIAIVAAIIGGAIDVAQAVSAQTGSMMNQIYVGDHLHTMSVLDHRFFMTGHQGAGMSDDGGKTWIPMSSLNGADVMSWTTSSKMTLAGGHNGLYKSTNNGLTFKQAKFYGSTSDVHAIGASGKYVYLGSPQVGFLMSTDGGVTWKMRNSKAGQNFMGSMLVDPKNPLRIIAPDMSAGLSLSSDGGLTWSGLGGPGGPMAVAWNGKNTKEIASIGMMSGGISSDGGKTWQTSAITTTAKKVAAMDPNMPGMNHVELVSSKRPIALTLGTFGFGTSSVFVTALLLRRKDRARNVAKKSTLASRGAGK